MVQFDRPSRAHLPMRQALDQYSRPVGWDTHESSDSFVGSVSTAYDKCAAHLTTHDMIQSTVVM